MPKPGCPLLTLYLPYHPLIYLSFSSLSPMNSLFLFPPRFVISLEALLLSSARRMVIISRQYRCHLLLRYLDTHCTDHGYLFPWASDPGDYSGPNHAPLAVFSCRCAASLERTVWVNKQLCRTCDIFHGCSRDFCPHLSPETPRHNDNTLGWLNRLPKRMRRGCWILLHVHQVVRCYQPEIRCAVLYYLRTFTIPFPT